MIFFRTFDKGIEVEQWSRTRLFEFIRHIFFIFLFIDGIYLDEIFFEFFLPTIEYNDRKLFMIIFFLNKILRNI